MEVSSSLKIKESVLRNGTCDTELVLWTWKGKGPSSSGFSIGNSMSNSDIWHKYHEWYFEIVIWNNFEISRVVFKQKSRTNDAIHLYTTTRKVL